MFSWGKTGGRIFNYSPKRKYYINKQQELFIYLVRSNKVAGWTVENGFTVVNCAGTVSYQIFEVPHNNYSSSAYIDFRVDVGKPSKKLESLYISSFAKKTCCFSPLIDKTPILTLNNIGHYIGKIYLKDLPYNKFSMSGFTYDNERDPLEGNILPWTFKWRIVDPEK